MEGPSAASDNANRVDVTPNEPKYKFSKDEQICAETFIHNALINTGFCFTDIEIKAFPKQLSKTMPTKLVQRAIIHMLTLVFGDIAPNCPNYSWNENEASEIILNHLKEMDCPIQMTKNTFSCFYLGLDSWHNLLKVFDWICLTVDELVGPVLTVVLDIDRNKQDLHSSENVIKQLSNITTSMSEEDGQSTIEKLKFQLNEQWTELTEKQPNIIAVHELSKKYARVKLKMENTLQEMLSILQEYLKERKVLEKEQKNIKKRVLKLIGETEKLSETFQSMLDREQINNNNNNE